MFVTVDLDIPDDSVLEGITAYDYGQLLVKELQHKYGPYGAIVRLGGVLGGPGTGIS